MVAYLFPLVYCVAVSARGGSHTSWKITATNQSQTKLKIVSTWINLCFKISCKLLPLYATWESASSDTALHVKLVKQRSTGSAAQSATGTAKSMEVCLDNGLCQLHWLPFANAILVYSYNLANKKVSKNTCILYQLLIMWQVSKHQSRKQRPIRPVSRAKEHLHTLGFGLQIFLPLFVGYLNVSLGKMKCILYHPCSYLQWFPHIHSSNRNTPLWHLWLNMVWHILNE